MGVGIMNNFEMLKLQNIHEAKKILKDVYENKCKVCIYNSDYNDCHANFCRTAIPNWLEFKYVEGNRYYRGA